MLLNHFEICLAFCSLHSPYACCGPTLAFPGASSSRTTGSPAGMRQTASVKTTGVSCGRWSFKNGLKHPLHSFLVNCMRCRFLEIPSCMLTKPPQWCRHPHLHDPKPGGFNSVLQNATKSTVVLRSTTKLFCKKRSISQNLHRFNL